MYADDLVEWLMTIACNATTDCPVYNVGSDQAVIMGDLARLVGKEFGAAVDIPEISDTAVDRYVPSIEQARRKLGLGLKYDLVDAISLSVMNC